MDEDQDADPNSGHVAKSGRDGRGFARIGVLTQEAMILSPWLCRFLHVIYRRLYYWSIEKD